MTVPALTCGASRHQVIHEKMKARDVRPWSVCLLLGSLPWLGTACTCRPAAPSTIEHAEAEFGEEELEAVRARERARIEAEWANSPPLPEEEALAYRRCEMDEECVYVTNGCCDCVNGGKDLAVNREQVDAFRKNFVCSGRCTMIGTVVACGSGTVACEGGLCVYHRPPSPIPIPSE